MANNYIQWIGLRENLQETMVFYHQIKSFPVNFSIIQFYDIYIYEDFDITIELSGPKPATASCNACSSFVVAI